MDLKGFSTGVCPCKATQSHDVNGEPLVPNFSEVSQRGADELLQYTTRYVLGPKTRTLGSKTKVLKNDHFIIL